MVVVEDGWVGEVVVWMCEVVLVGENIVVHHRCGRILGEIELEIGTEIEIIFLLRGIEERMNIRKCLRKIVGVLGIIEEVEVVMDFGVVGVVFEMIVDDRCRGVG